MKKTIIVLAIILTSGIAALGLSITKTEDVKIAQVKADRNTILKSNEFGKYKSDIASAD